MNKVFLIIFSMILLIGMIGTIDARLGCYKPNENFQIITNSNSSAVNISEIINPTPNSEFVLRNVQMTKLGNSFNLSFNDSKLGTYNYGFCELDTGNCYSNTFDITPSGRCDSAANIVFIIILILLIYAIAFIGFFSKNIPMTILGGMTMIFLGVYTINNGIIIFKDDLTRYVSYLTSFLGAVIALWAGIEYIQENM